MTISNAKNKKLCDLTKSTTAKVYTQDLKLKHEDRFLFAFTTMSNLNDIKRTNPNDIFISQLIIPPGQTILSGFSRLLENTLSQISSQLDVIVFGGTSVLDENREDDENAIPYDYQNAKSEPFDLAFSIGNIIHKIFPKHIRFSHFGTKQNYNKLLETHDYAQLKNNVTKSSDILDNINLIPDDSRYEYDLRFLTHAMFDVISKNNPCRIELLVKYKIVDMDDFNSFKTATEANGYSVLLSDNKFLIEKK